eukprot:COSAG01_NODE_13168_length_1625_cov_3.823067_1_plen_61_part_10
MASASLPLRLLPAMPAQPHQLQRVQWVGDPTRALAHVEQLAMAEMPPPVHKGRKGGLLWEE